MNIWFSVEEKGKTPSISIESSSVELDVKEKESILGGDRNVGLIKS